MNIAGYLDQVERLFVECLDEMIVSGNPRPKDVLYLCQCLTAMCSLRKQIAADAETGEAECSPYQERNEWPAVPAAE